MKQEDKELLLKDLCTRIPYNTIVHLNLDWGQKWQVDAHISKDIDDIFYILETQPERVKPYLRPMSSMTKEEKEELMKIADEYIEEWINAQTPIDKWKLDAKISYKKSVFYNSHHLDWNDLISNGLAIEATGENNPYK